MPKGTYGFETYLSPFTTRYGSREMRELFSQENYFASHRRVWVALAQAQSRYGLITPEELAEIEGHAGKEHVDIDDIRERDRKIHHDLTAHLKSYATQCGDAGGKLHLGGTSMDVEDNADILRLRQATDILTTRAVNTLDSMRPYLEAHSNLRCIAWTHIQPAGYTTVGYRFANYAQQLLLALDFLEFVTQNHLKGKGMKGITGAGSSYTELLGSPESALEMERQVLKKLELDAFPVSTQVYPRIVDFTFLSSLAAFGAAANKFALDIRLFSSPNFGEFYKRPSPDKVGSSAAPWKIYNPTEAERINSLSRYVAGLPGIAWTNAANDIFERTLDDSANRRTILPEGCLAIDQVLIEYDNILRNIGIRREAINRNIKNYGFFTRTEPLMMEAVKRGADRQKFHESVRRHIFGAYERMMAYGENPLPQMLREDEEVLKYFGPGEIDAFFYGCHEGMENEVGFAPQATRKFLNDTLNPFLERHRGRLGIHVEPEF